MRYGGLNQKSKAFADASDRSYSDHLRTLVDNFKTNPKGCWSVLKCLNKKESSVSPVLRDGAWLVSADSGHHFPMTSLPQSFVTLLSLCMYPHTPDYDVPVLNSVNVSQDEVRLILESINETKPCGPDNT